MENSGNYGFHPFVILLSMAIIPIVWAFGFLIGLPLFVSIPLAVAAGMICVLSLRIASQWEKAVIMRMGKFYRLAGPGPFFLIPIIDSVSYWIDLRTIASPFRAEQTLTRDNVPVDVDEVLFWRVIDPKKAALEVENYREAISWAAQTALRDVIGETDLSSMMVGRRELGPKLAQLIDERSADWGIHVIAVELRDVRIPADLQNAMSKKAQAEREREARVILADSERLAASKFKEAATHYREFPEALNLRGMNMLLEGMKQNATIVVVPSSAVEAMSTGGLLSRSGGAKGSLESSL